MKIGIDPDKAGAFCIMDKGVILEVKPFILEQVQVGKKFKDMISYHKTSLTITHDIEGCDAYIEKPFVPATHGGGEVTWRNYQTAYLLFQEIGCNMIEVRPQKWHKQLGVSAPDHIDKKERRPWIKNACHELVKTKYPDVDLSTYSTKTGKKLKAVNQGIIDSICIALYENN